MKNYSTLTQRYLKQHKGRTILTLIGIIISIAMFTCIGSIYYSGINGEIESAREGSDFEVVFAKTNKAKINIIASNAEIKNGGIVKEEGAFQIDNSQLTPSLKALRIKAYDGAAFKDVFEMKIIEGRFPQNSSEIVVDKKFYSILKNRKIDFNLSGDFKTLEGVLSKTQYKVVGSYESNVVTNQAMCYLDMKTSADSNNYSFYANLKQEKGKVDLAKKIADKNGVKLDVNTSLLYLLGEGPDKDKNNDIAVVFSIIAGFVVICTVVVIYNAFNISVMERIKHFGILRSIGATKSQIKRLVFKEAAIMSLLSVPIGIITGFTGMFVVFNFFMGGFLGNFEIGLYPEVIVGAALLGILTVFISSFFPARTASKVSPIEAIRGNTVVKGDKVKKRRGLWAKMLFQFEGQVAYKNIKRSRKRFYITCLSLMISLVMYVFFSNFTALYMESNQIAMQNIKIEGILQQSNLSLPVLNKKIAEDISRLEGVKEVFKINTRTVPYSIDENKISDNFVAPLMKIESTIKYKDKYIIGNTQLIGYDENTLKMLAKENKLNVNYESFNKNNEIIICNKAASYDDNSKRFYGGFTKYKVGDEITLPVVNEEYMKNAEGQKLKGIIDNGKTMTFKVVSVVDYDIIKNSYTINGYGMIMSNENYKKLTGVEGYEAVALNFTSTENSNKLFEQLNIVADENQVSYLDVYKMKNENSKVMTQLFVLIYGFIGLIILISTVNIINTVTINLLVKKREYATFKAIGMTKGQFMKLVLLEGVLFGVIACIIGLPMSFLLTKWVETSNPLGDIGFTFSAWPYASGAIGMLAITLLAALFPLRKLNEMNIVESLRLEE